MAYPRTPRRSTLSARQTTIEAGKTYPKSALRTTKNTTIETSSDNDSNDDDADDSEHDESDEQEDDDDEDEEEELASELDEETLSRSYPFEFDQDGSLTGTDDEMDVDMTQPRSTMGLEFEKSMELADANASGGAHDSDNEDYDGVNVVSEEEEADDDQSEVDVLREAEQDLIAEFEETEHTRTPTTESLAAVNMDLLADSRRFSFDNEADALALMPGVNMNEDPFQGAAFMSDTWGSLWENAELGIWRKPGADNEMAATTNNNRQKRVRFQESTATLARVSSNSSSESSDDEEADQFPDIFMDQADPKIQQILARDTDSEWNGLSTNGSDVESVYDFEDDADRFAFELDENSGSSEADVSSESEDDGDDTEDETVEEQQAKMQQFRKAMREAAATSKLSTPRPEKATPSSSVKSTPSSKRPVTPKFGKGPLQGTFVCDPTKATLTTDRSTRKTILYPPSQPSAQQKAFWDRAKSAVKANDGSPRPAIAIPAVRDNSPERPFTARATLASMFDGRIDVFEDAAMPAPPQAVQPFLRFPPTLMSSFTSVADENSDMDAEYPEEFSNILNMEQFQDDSSDVEMDTPGGALFEEPAFLSHGVVGSFRLNQHRAKIESSLASHPAKRNATAEHNALQNGRRAAGNAPITPARKRRSNSQDWNKTGSGIKKPSTPAFSSPLIARRRHSRGQSLSGRLEQTLTSDMFKKM